ncbi:MAG: hypothetical protein K6C14_00060 [Eubacterium sp.]|nr:hypothetical protein [Eubacterium sp.]
MSSVYERLTELFSVLGLDVQAGSYAEAEAAAYTAGINVINEKLEALKEKLFFSLYGGEADYYASVMGINTDFLTAEQVTEAVKNRYSYGFGACSLKSAFDGECAVLGGAQYEYGNGKLIIRNCCPPVLENVGAFSLGAVPVGTAAEFDSDGMRFSDWNALSKSFRQYDRLRLTFSLIDTLSTEYFE